MAAASALDVTVVALHVHHGLHRNADAWLSHCAATCASWAGAGARLRFRAERLGSQPAAGESVEAWARRERYRALARMAEFERADLVLLAHHRRDQAETFLLQALRGGGVEGLAAMPREARRGGTTWARPWLDRPRDAIERYLGMHGLRWIDDDSNDDDRFARNRLRRRVWPSLLDAFADAEAALAAAASRAQQALEVVDEVAGRDLEVVVAAGANGQAGVDDESLPIGPWLALSPARRRQVLRSWLKQRCGRPVPATLVDRLCAELRADGHRQWPAPGGALRSAGGVLCWRASTDGELHGARNAVAPVVTEAGDARRRDAGRRAVDLSRPGLHSIGPWRGALRVERVRTGGLAPELAARIELRARAPGDRFRAGVDRPSRSLKLQFQAHGVASTDRDGPIGIVDGRIVFVAGLGVDAGAVAAPGTPQLAVRWEREEDRGDGPRERTESARGRPQGAG